MNARVLRLLALVIFGIALAWWLAAGAHRGRTQTSVPVTRTDEVTGISVDDYQDRFVPGIDFLAAGLLAAGAMAGVSFFVGKKRIST